MRKAVIVDIPRLQELLTSAIISISRPGYTEYELQVWIEQYTREQVLAVKITDPDSYFIVYSDDDGVIHGAGVLTGEEIHGVYADPGSQVKGIGTAVMDHLEDVARNNGIGEIVINSSLPAQGFYSNRGYLESGPMQFDMGGCNNPGIVMKKSLENK